MSQLHQVQLSLDALQDRLLMRLRTTDGAQFRFWLTRRFVIILWQAMQQLMRQTSVAPAQHAIAHRELIAFRSEQATADSDFSSSFDDRGATLPLGEEPLLLSTVQIRATQTGAPVLALLPHEGPGVELALNDHMLFSITRLLAETVRAANWSLDMRIPESTVAAPGPGRMN